MKREAPVKKPEAMFLKNFEPMVELDGSNQYTLLQYSKSFGLEDS